MDDRLIPNQNPRDQVENWGRLGLMFAEGIAALKSWWDRPATQEAFSKLLRLPGETEEKLKTQRRFLRKGFLPSAPVVAFSDRLEAMTPQTISTQYLLALDALGHSDDANIFKRMGEVSTVACSTHMLRIIYPEIEAVARKYIYLPEVTEGITSLLEMRIAIGSFLNGSPVSDATAIVEIEPFFVTNLLAIDFAYIQSYEVKRRGSLIFSKVANRHHVCHGISDQYNQTHVINGLTLLYVSILAGHMMQKNGTRLNKTPKNAKNMLDKERENQRIQRQEIFSLHNKILKPFRGIMTER
ncbi:hypothetical protein ACQZ4X_17240 [Agrobacterium vitis]